jgi:hypothetical protein
MAREHDASRGASGSSREVGRLVERIQTLVPEIRELEQGKPGDEGLAAKRRELERLRWRLAAVARRLAEEEAA